MIKHVFLCQFLIFSCVEPKVRSVESGEVDVKPQHQEKVDKLEPVKSESTTTSTPTAERQKPSDVTTTEKIPSQQPETQTQPVFDVSYKSFLVLNSKAETYSLIRENADHSLSSTENLVMSSGANSDFFPCKAANQILPYKEFYYIVCSLSNEIHIVNKENLSLIKRFSTGDNSNPMQIVIANDQLAFVSNFILDEILVVNPQLDISEDRRILAKISLKKLQMESDDQVKTKAKPSGLLLNREYLYVALANFKAGFVAGGPGYVAKININDFSKIELIKTNGRNTTALASVSEQEMYIVNTGTYDVQAQGYLGDGSIDVYDHIKAKIVKSISFTAAPMGVSFSPDFKEGFITNGADATIYKLDLERKEISSYFTIQNSPCAAQTVEQFSYLTSIVVDSNSLFLTEFNSNCFIKLDRKSKNIISYEYTGDGPVTMQVH